MGGCGWRRMLGGTRAAGPWLPAPRPHPACLCAAGYFSVPSCLVRGQTDTEIQRMGPPLHSLRPGSGLSWASACATLQGPPAAPSPPQGLCWWGATLANKNEESFSKAGCA